MEKRTKKFYLGPEGIHYPYKCTAICEDGKIRMVFLNQEPDTFFSHPGRTKISRKSIRGFVSVKEDGEMYFTAYKKQKRNGITDFELIKFGFDFNKTFPGCGIIGTRFSRAITGIGTTEDAAFASIIDQIEQVERTQVDFIMMEEQAGELGQLESDGSEEGKGKGDAWFYYAIRYNFG